MKPSGTEAEAAAATWLHGCRRGQLRNDEINRSPALPQQPIYYSIEANGRWEAVPPATRFEAARLLERRSSTHQRRQSFL